MSSSSKEAYGERITNLRADIAKLKHELIKKEKELCHTLALAAESTLSPDEQSQENKNRNVCELKNDEIARYSRQIILPEFGLKAQLKLRSTSVLIVGMGGLGCPAAQYLAAAGCGQLYLVDYDDVEVNNLHRQTLHTTTRIGLPKVDSAQLALRDINPHCKVIAVRQLLSKDNAMELIEKCDVVLDCSDNVATRYLLNDACVLAKKPLVSGSALQLDGQLTVYNHGADCPCYRCIFPKPPPPDTVTNCGDGGVLGAVTGVIGSLQALEAIKIAMGEPQAEVLAGRLLLFDGMRNIFRNVKLRQRRSDCEVCSDQPKITQLIDYEKFCGMPASDKDCGLNILKPEQRISAEAYANDLKDKSHLLIDVRQPAEFEICSMAGAVNMPLKKLRDESRQEELAIALDNTKTLVFVCRRGNDSQLAVEHVRKKFPNHQTVCDIRGGLHAWQKNIDPDFPVY